MAVKLWLDDLRPAPKGWVWCKTATEAIALLKAGNVFVASLDHDLGGAPYAGPGEDGLDGMAVINFMEKSGIWPERVIVHSFNIQRARVMVDVARRYTTAIRMPYTGKEI